MGRNAGTAFEADVIKLACDCGWYVAHFRSVATIDRRTHEVRFRTPVAADGKGFPDLVLVKHRILYRECKSGRARLEDEQAEWGRRISAAGGDWDVWTDKMWPEIKATLTERMGRNDVRGR